MTLLASALRRMSAALEASGHQFALVGGLAVSVRSEPRMTRDADFVVVVDDDSDAERLISSLHSVDFVASTLVEQVATDRLATVRLEHASTPGLLTDLLFSSCGIEREIVDSAERMEVMEVESAHVIAPIGARDGPAPREFADLDGCTATVHLDGTGNPVPPAGERHRRDAPEEAQVLPP